MKEFQLTVINGEIFHVHGLEELVLLQCLYQMSILPKANYRVNKILIKIPMSVLIAIE